MSETLVTILDKIGWPEAFVVGCISLLVGYIVHKLFIFLSGD